MASVTVSPIPEPKPPRSVTIQLTEREAQVLATIFGRIGGAPEGPRGVAQDIQLGLTEAGIFGDGRLYDEPRTYKGSIYLVSDWPAGL